MKKMKRITLIFGLLLISQMYVNAQTKRVLIEEGTGTWCNWCPRGMVFGEQMVHEYDAIFIAIHMGDVMESTPDYADATNITGLPTGNVDRTEFFVDPADWETSVINQLNETPPADISVTTTFDVGTREIIMTVSADFFTSLNGDYRLGAVVVEDAVTGTTIDYDQSNAYSGGSEEMGGFENLPNPVPAALMVYDHVSRYLATDYEGDPGSLPGSIANGSQHSHTLSWTLPVEYNEEYTHVVGYITNATTGKILNAGKSAYLLGNTNAQPFFVSEGETTGLLGSYYQYDILTHDPDDLELIITAVDIPNWMTLTITGELTANLAGTPTTEGIYPVTLNVSDGNSSRNQDFEVEVINSGGIDWYVVGEENFTNESVRSVDLEINNLGTPYVLSVTESNQISVHTFENDSWSVLGNTIPGDQFFTAMTLSQDSTPYVLTSDNGLKVYRFDGTNWEQVGGNVGSDGVALDIAISDDDTLYVSYQDITSDSKGMCKKWDGTNWVIVGGNHFTASTAVWTKITTNSNNQPVILYATYSGSAFSNVTVFDGTNWEILGGGNIDSSNTTYFIHSLVIDENDKIYVSIAANSTQQLNVYEWNSSAWSIIGDNISGGSVYENSITLDLQGNPVVGFRDESEGGKTTVMRLESNNWATLGLAGFTNIASFQSLAYSPDGEPYIAFKDETNGGKMTVKRYGQDVLNIIDFSNTISDIKVYPNPNSGEFTILSNIEGRFQLTDMQGRIISEGILEPVSSENGKNTYSFNHTDLPQGLYLLNIANEQKREVVKILIK